MAEEYLKLSISERKTEFSLQPILTSLAQEALSPSFDAETRRKCISRLLEDLSKQTWNEQTLKLLGRSAHGSDELATETGIMVLLKRGRVVPASSTPPKSLPKSSLEALRCLCNVLLLSERARDPFEGMHGALEGIVGYLTDPAPAPAHFLAGRMLFLLTAKGGELNRILVEEHQVSERLAEALSRFLAYMKKPNMVEGEDRMMALGEHLKLLFNIVNFYPRVLVLEKNAVNDNGSRPASPASMSSSTMEGSPKLDSASMKRKTSSAIKDFFSRPRQNTGSRPSSPGLTSPRPEAVAEPLGTRGFPVIVTHLVSLVLCLPMGSGDYLPKPPLAHALHALAEFPMSEAWLATPRNLSMAISAEKLPTTSISDPEGKRLPRLPLLLIRLLDILDIATAHFCANDPDSDEAMARVKASSAVDVDASLASLLLLLRKIVIGDTTGVVQNSLRARLLADDIDRSQPLDRRRDLTGRLVRLMSATYLSNTKVGASEFLFALCGQDPAVLSSTIGWGNAAGFLTSNNLATGLPETDTLANGDARINPVTGAFFDAGEPAGANLSEEEKLAEAERLMVLFDRLGKTGVVKVGNPMQQAQEEGRFETVDDAEETTQRQEKEEQEALEDLQRYKERRDRLRSHV